MRTMTSDAPADYIFLSNLGILLNATPHPEPESWPL